MTGLDEARAGVVVTAGDGGGSGGVLSELLRRGRGGERDKAAVAVPGAERVVVPGAALVDDVAREVEVDVADGVAGTLDGVDVAGLDGEGYGMREVDAGVFIVVVDEDGDGDEARSVWLGHVAGPLVNADGAGDALGFVDVVHLRGDRQSEGEGETGADDADARH